jgi:acetyl-CoA carboxylase biotin carboxyl carrier protein
MTDESNGSGGGMRVDAELVRQLAELLNQNELTEIEVADGDRRIAVKRQVMLGQSVHAVGPAAAAAPAPAGAPGQAAAPAADVAPANHPGAVKSPMVGTVYLSAEPGARPFVAPGGPVSEGETLLIIEAMKVMNPITAPRSGTVRQVLVQDGQPVEFDQPLVIIE